MGTLALVTRSAADGPRYLLPVVVSGSRPSTSLLLLATTYDAAVLHASSADCQLCFNASAPSSDSCKIGAWDQEGQIFDPWCAADAFDFLSDESVPISLSALRPEPSLPWRLMAKWGADASSLAISGVPASGVFGLGGLGRPGQWAASFGAYGFRFTLDLKPMDQQSHIVIGSSSGRSDDNAGSGSTIQWSVQRHPSSLHTLDVYALSICGASLLGTSTWPALVDTSASCLGLPAPIFTALFSWVAAACSGDGRHGGDGTRCRVQPDANGVLPTLPILTFRLSQHGPQLQLPLASLLLPAADGSDPTAARELCIRNLESDTYNAGDAFPEERAHILLGTHVLSQFRVHIEAAPGQRRVGFEPRDAPLSLTDRVAPQRACAARTECVGQQSFLAATDTCHQPECSAFFQTVDVAEGRCKWLPEFQVGAAIVLGGFALVELAMQRLRVAHSLACPEPTT